MKKSLIAATLATGAMLGGPSSAFAEVCDKIASVGDIKVQNDWVSKGDKVTQTGPEKLFIEIKMPDCENQAVVGILPTAEQVFESIRSYRDGSMHPNDVTRNAISAYYDAALILKEMKADPSRFNLQAKHVAYNTDIGLGMKLDGLKVQGPKQ